MKLWMTLGAIALLAVALACPSSAADQDKGGGIVPGLASCCLPIGIPGGQVMNSGLAIPGRSWARILIIPILIDGVKAFTGETAEEYLGVDSIPSDTAEEGKGGLGPGIISACCWAGVPTGQMMNSNMTVPTRSWLKLVPYVNSVVTIYDGFKAFQGETLQQYCEIK